MAKLVALNTKKEPKLVALQQTPTLPAPTAVPERSGGFTHSSGKFGSSIPDLTVQITAKERERDQYEPNSRQWRKANRELGALYGQQAQAEAQEAYRNTRIANTVSGAAELAASGYANTAGTLADLVQRYNVGAYYTNPDDWKNAVERAQTEPSWKIVDALQGTADTLQQRGEQNVAEAREGLGWVGQRLVDAGVSGIQMLGDAVANAVAPGAGLASLGARAFGSSAGEARREGADVGQQFLYGLTNAAVEVLSEKIGDVPGIYGGGWIDDAVKSVVSKWNASPVMWRAAMAAASALGESVEELAAGLVEPGLKSIYNGKGFGQNYSKEDWQEMRNAMFVGGLLGGLGGLSPNVQYASPPGENAPTNVPQEAAAGRQARQSALDRTTERTTTEAVPGRPNEAYAEAKNRSGAMNAYNAAADQYGVFSPEEIEARRQAINAIAGSEPEVTREMVREVSSDPEQLRALGIDPKGKSGSEVRAEVRAALEAQRQQRLGGRIRLANNELPTALPLPAQYDRGAASEGTPGDTGYSAEQKALVRALQESAGYTTAPESPGTANGYGQETNRGASRYQQEGPLFGRTREAAQTVLPTAREGGVLPTARQIEERQQTTPPQTEQNAEQQPVSVRSTEPGLVRDDIAKRANLTNREARAIDALGRVIGKKIRFAESLTAEIQDEEGNIQRSGANAQIDGDTITISLQSEDPFLVAAVHEVVHGIRDIDEDAYQALAKFVTNNMSDRASFFATMEQAELGYSQEQIPEETVATAFGRMLGDEKTLRQFVSENTTAAERFMDALRDLLDRVRQVLTGSKRETNTLTDNQRAVYKDLEGRLDKMLLYFTDALNAVKESENAEGSGERRYALSANAADEIHRAVTDKNYGGDVRLTDTSPSIMIGHRGVRNLPMLMKASHVRENILTEAEARALGISVDPDHDHYHGLTEPVFKDVIDHLDDVSLAYRGTRYAKDPSRRENYFLLLSTIPDSNGGQIIVPVYINERAMYNHVYIDTNKIATVFSPDEAMDYVKKNVANKNLVRIKKRGPASSESPAHTAVDYADVTSAEEAANQAAMASYEDNVSQTGKESKKNFSDADYLAAVELGMMDEAQEMVNDRAKESGLFKRNAGEEIAIYIPDGRTKSGETVNFTDAIFDNKKHGETRGLNTHLPVGKWLGTAKGGKVVGRVKFGSPVEITTESPEYADAMIRGTQYDIKPGEKKLYYPIVDKMDLRTDPRPVVRNGNYGVYQFKSSDTATYDDDGNVIPVSKRFDTRNPDKRYSRKAPSATAPHSLMSSAVYNHTVVLNESTVDKYLKDYASASSPNYAQAYITYMSPKQFLDLTTSAVGRAVVSSETQELDTDKLAKATVANPFQLIINHETGEVSGHEGRHRANALLREGINKIPVLLFDSSNKNSKTAIESLTLTGQDFGNSRSTASVTVNDVQPLSYANRDNIVNAYATQPTNERLMEKYGDRKTVRYSLKPVKAVEPSSGTWTRGATYDEVKEAHPTLYDLTADENETRNPTQVTVTQKSYRKIYKALQDEGFDGTILDASSGLGIGTEVGRKEFGYEVEDIEPYPDKSYKPMYTDYSTLDNTYDVIISNAVLNVLPQDLRDDLTVKMGEMLNPGGRLYVNVRGSDVKNAKSKVPINEAQMEYFIEDGASYQKGFTRGELKAYLEDALGPGFTVRQSNQFGQVSAVVTRDGGKAMRTSSSRAMATGRSDLNENFAKVRYSLAPPYRPGTAGYDGFIESLNKEARSTYDMFSGIHEYGAQNKVSVNGSVKDITQAYMTAAKWNAMCDSNAEFAKTAKALAESLPDDVRKAARISTGGRILETAFEKEFKMERSFIQRIIDSLPNEVASSTYRTGGKTIRVAKGDKVESIGGEGYRRALVEERRALYRVGKLPTKSIGGLSKDTWGAMGFLATNGKTGASGDFTTLCPQMYFNKGCFYCYRRAALTTGVNNKLMGENVWYSGEILHLTKEDIDNLNKNGGLRIQSFGDWMSKYSTQLADLLIDAETVGLQIKIITKEPSMIETVALLKDQKLGKNLYFNLSADYTIEKQGTINNQDTEGALPRNPLRPYQKIGNDTYWKRALTVEEANEYRKKYPWVNTRIVATTVAEFLEGLRSPYVDVVTGYHGNIRQFERVSSATGETLLQVEPLGDAGMPRFSFDSKKGEWVLEYAGKTETHKKLAAAIADAGLQFQYYIKSCCITGRCATCEGKCGKLAKDFNVKNATNADKQSVAYWQKHMTSAEDNPLLLDQMEDEQAKALLENEVRYSRSGREALDELIEQYGQIETGEKPVRDVPVPRRTTDKTKVSMTVRTVAEAGATPESFVPTIENLVANHEFDYTPYSDKRAIKTAESEISSKGFQPAFAEWEKAVGRGEVSKTNTAIGWALYNNAVNSGDTEAALTILRDIVYHQRNAAQAVQATRILKQLNPETQLYNTERTVEQLNEELKKKYGKKAPDLQIDPDLAERFLRARSDKGRAEAMSDIYRDIGRQMPARFVDRWNAWRYLAMLGNPRTHIRNIVGNAGFAPVVAAKNITATGIERAVDFLSGGKLERTKGNIVGRGDLMKAAWKDYDNIRGEALGEGKYSDSQIAQREIQDARRIFGNTKSKWWNKSGGALLEGLRKFNGTALDAEDVWFSKPHYTMALAQYCAANKISADQIKSGRGLEKARAYAIKEAQKATYRDTNAFSQLVSRLGRNAQRDGSTVSKLASTVVEGILPFRKTPANILARGVEYSPIGLLKSLTYDLAQVKKGTMTGADMIDDLSAGLTGTGLLALGFYLAAQGVLRGRGGDDDKERKFSDLTGHQNYAIELADGTSVTLDWLAPEALPLFIGANLAETAANRKDGLKMSDVITSISNVSEPLLEMSCLQSLNAMLDTVGYAKEGDVSALAAILASAATSYLTQALPTVFGQAERTGETKRMTTYTDKNMWLTGDTQYTIGKASARVPGVDFNQVPYIDAWGREELTGGFLTRAFNNFINPAYISKVNESAMEKEIQRLYDATGENVFPQRPSKYITVNKERKDLSGEEYVTYATERGRTSYAVVGGMINSRLYQRMSDADKATSIRDAYDYANQTARTFVGGMVSDSWVDRAREGVRYGIKPEDYILVKNTVNGIQSLKDSNGESIDNSAGLQKMEAIYQVPGLTQDQRRYLFQCFGVGKTVIDLSEEEVKSKLSSMRK